MYFFLSISISIYIYIDFFYFYVLFFLPLVSVSNNVTQASQKKEVGWDSYTLTEKNKTLQGTL